MKGGCVCSERDKRGGGGSGIHPHRMRCSLALDWFGRLVDWTVD